MEPTVSTYAELRLAYDTFNIRLFDAKLPQCLLTLQREKRTYGYFSSQRFGNRQGQTTDEIALNPEYFAVIPLIETLQTIAHEMAHLWQAHFGKPGRARYHNAEWADKMESIGLMPSSTGRPGGRRVGDVMADYAIANGRFASVVDELVSSKRFGITWFDRFTPPAPLYPVDVTAAVAGVPQEAFAVPAAEGVQLQPKTVAPRAPDRSNRIKYSCSKCGLNVWGKPAIRVACLACNIELEPSEADLMDADASFGRTARSRYRMACAARSATRTAEIETNRRNP